MKVIGVDLGGTNVSAGLVKDNKLIKVIKEKINSQGSEKEVLKQIMNIINKLITKEVKGIGIGVPSIVDIEKGIVFETVNIPSWKNVKLKKILEKKYKIPVFVNNDANCFALGEKYFGQGKGYKNLVGIVIGTGLGGGIIINNKLYNGNNCGAGEFGEIIFKNSKVEHYTSGKFFEKFYYMSGEDVFEKAKKRDSKTLKIFNEFGYNLGKVLSIIVNSVDPELIILGGSISKAHKFFFNAMMRSLKESIYRRSYSRLKIKISNQENIAVFGAASLYYNSLN